jgi:fibronectin-binding autotransporter adhesin
MNKIQMNTESIPMPLKEISLAAPRARSSRLIAGTGISALALILASASAASAQEVIDDGVNNGIVTVPGDKPNPWDLGVVLIVGDSGTGMLTIKDGGVVSNTAGRVGDDASGVGAVMVSGNDGAGNASHWINSAALQIGVGGTGTLTVEGGGKVSSDSGSIGKDAGSKGTVTVRGTDADGNASRWINVVRGLDVGGFGEGLLSIEDGGIVENFNGIIGASLGGNGDVTVTGTGSRWINGGSITVGAGGTGRLTVEGGASVTGNYGYIGDRPTGEGTVTVSGADSAGNVSSWISRSGIEVAGDGAGTLTIANGGFVSSPNAYIGTNAGSSGVATVSGISADGTASRWDNDASFHIGFRGNAALTIADGGVVSATIARIATHGGSSAILNIGAAAGATATGAGTLAAATLSFGDGDGTLIFNHSDGNYEFAAQLSSNGTGAHILEHHAGTTMLTGNSIGFGGTTTISGGQLVVNGTLGGTTHVLADGTLAGAGTLTGAIDIADGGTLLGVQGQTLTMASLALSSGSNVDVTLGAPGNAAGLFSITNDLVLDGQLNVTSGLGYGQGVYRLFDYGGTVSDNGLDIAAMPTGTTGLVQTSVDKQVNLVVSGPPDLGPVPDIQFWNGTTMVANGAVNGGSGAWNDANINWTDANGTRVDAWGSKFAVFQNNPDVVTVDGGVAATGMQFIGEGWRVEGDAITLAGDNGATTIRVGDGSGIGTHLATIASALSGASALVKDDQGVLILSGENSYSGGTAIKAGTLQIGDGGTTGSIQGDVANDGLFALNRSDAISFGGKISGTGDVTLLGGDVTFTAANNYAGITSLLAGATLRLGDGGTVGSITGPVDNAGTLVFNRSDDIAFAGAISGGGTIRHMGGGKTELTADSSAFAGTTEVEAGILAVNGSLGGTMNLLAGGRLQGTGTVGDMLVSGTIAPGNSIGTLNVAGNISFAAGSIYEVEANAAGEADRIAASGAATINGGLVQVLAGAGDYRPQTDYTILTADGGVTGTFTDVTSNLAFLDPSLVYGADNVTLRLTRNSISFAGIGLTPNQIAAGAGTESLDWGSPVVDAVMQLSAEQGRDAFDQLSGEIHPSARHAMVEDSRLVRHAVWDRLRGAAADDRGGVWGQAIGSWGHSGGDGNAARLDRSTAGLLMGVDRAGETMRFGVVGGYSRTNIDVDARGSSGKIGNFHLGAYAGGQWGDVAVRTGLAYSWQDIQTTRAIGFSGFSDTARAEYDGGTFQAFGELGYGFDLGRARIEPFANLAYVRAQSDAFAETGGEASLFGGKATTDVTFSTLGLRATTMFDLGKADASFRAAAGWRHAFGDKMPMTVMGYQAGGNAFPIAGLPVARDAATLDAGLDVAISSKVRIGIGYSGQIGSRLADHSAKASISFRF